MGVQTLFDAMAVQTVTLLAMNVLTECAMLKQKRTGGASGAAIYRKTGPTKANKK